MLLSLIIFASIAILTSFLCSLWESVLLSITPSYSEMQFKQGTKVGQYLREFKANIDRPLAAILTLNTVAHTVGAIGVGEQATKIWSETNPMVTGIVVPVVMTLAILILSEIIPKTIGANSWKRLVPFTVYSLHIIIWILYPAIWVCQLVTKMLRKDKEGSVFSRSEFLAMTEIGAAQGVFEDNESLIIKNLLRFNKIRVDSIMTPRTVVKTANAATSIKEFFKQNQSLSFSRIPIFEGKDSDHITGYVRKDELLTALALEDSDETIASHKRDIVVVRETFALPQVFNHFLEKREHIALVTDEFGSFEGIVTMEDIIETLLGLEIVDELDKNVDMQVLARKNWEKRAKELGLLEALQSDEKPTS